VALVGQPAFAGPLENFTVTFIENDSGADTVSTFQIGTGTQALTLFSNLNPQFSNAGHTFTGWNTAANGTGTAFANGANYSFAADIELFAQWSGSLATSTVTFNENDSTSDQVDSYETGASTQALTLFANLNPQFTNPGFVFAGWNTAANGSGTDYGNGAAYSFSADLELYAQWDVVPSTQPSAPIAPQSIQIVFSTNGGSGTLSSLSGASGTSFTLPNSSDLVRPGYTFASWNTNADGSGTSYSSGATVAFSSSLTLYAQWKATPTAVLYGDVGLFSKNSTELTETLELQVRHLAVTIKAKNYTKISLFGYTAQTGLDTLNASLSRARAQSVARYLRRELRTLHVIGVDISASGEGAISSNASPLYSRVEVFVS
jgi:uncharacterized repeat protein (TIGR02543 family)